MATVILRGGLGNQMLQYAAGLDAAKKNNTQLFLDTTFLNDRFPRKQFTYRKFDLDIFILTPRFTSLSKISNVTPIPGMWLWLDFAYIKVREIFGLTKIIKEKESLIFDQKTAPQNKSIVLWGYWQSEKYFTDVADDVRRAFRFKNELFGEAAELAEKIKSSNSVSLHVRRGDYLTFKNNKELFGETNISYYEKAIVYIAERVETPRFFVFSDDIAWCKENIKIQFPVIYVSDLSAGPKNAFHLELMSLCKHNIIANSSFSWWGAWLNSNPNKIVVTPEKWYAGQDSKTADITPRNWIKI